MSKKNKKLESLGYTLSCIGGLLVILNLTTWKNSEWGLSIAISAVVLALIGIYLIQKAKGNPRS